MGSGTYAALRLESLLSRGGGGINRSNRNIKTGYNSRYKALWQLRFKREHCFPVQDGDEMKALARHALKIYQDLEGVAFRTYTGIGPDYRVGVAFTPPTHWVGWILDYATENRARGLTSVPQPLTHVLFRDGWMGAVWSGLSVENNNGYYYGLVLFPGALEYCDVTRLRYDDKIIADARANRKRVYDPFNERYVERGDWKVPADDELRYRRRTHEELEKDLVLYADTDDYGATEEDDPDYGGGGGGAGRDPALDLLY